MSVAPSSKTTTTNSNLVDFYLGTKQYVSAEDDGLYIQEVLAKDDVWLEARHDYIQWLFPLPDASAHNFYAPLLTPADILKFKNNTLMQARFDAAFVRFAEFLGLSRASAVGFNAYEFKLLGGGPKPWMAANYDHNHLRITRMMASCRLVSTNPEIQVEPFYEALVDKLIKGKSRNVFGRKTQKFWENAAKKS